MIEVKNLQKSFKGVEVLKGINETIEKLSLIHISEPTRQAEISYAVFCLKKKKERNRMKT